MLPRVLLSLPVFALVGCATVGGGATLRLENALLGCAASGYKLSGVLRATCSGKECGPVVFHLPSSERVVILERASSERLDNADIHHEFGPSSFGAGPRVVAEIGEGKAFAFQFPAASEPGFWQCGLEGRCKVRWCFSVIFGGLSQGTPPEEFCADADVPKCI